MKVKNVSYIDVANFVFILTECDGLVKVISPSGPEEFCLSLEDILQFATGASSVPPIGFSPNPTVTFHESSPFPMANTCTNCLKLPLFTSDYDAFKYNFAYGIVNTAGFGQV